ncbi:MAG: hypothetical protein N3G80_03585 [Candidatus Micrarchaeota archaeon]|nr:hypothetical protein [Candidatus Micrarchaeota archaeon]
MLVKFILRDLIYYSINISCLITNFIFLPIKNSAKKKLTYDLLKGKIKKVLINRNDQIGDAVLSLQIIRQLSTKFFVTVVTSEKNLFIFQKLKNIKIRTQSQKPLFKYRGIFQKNLYFIVCFISCIFSNFFKIKKSHPKKTFDLIIDLSGDFGINSKYLSTYSIGPNRLFYSLCYTCWYKTTFSIEGTQGKHLLESYKDMLKDCLNIDIRLSDRPPTNFKKRKKKQIFIFVGCRSERNLTYKKWKEFILAASKYGKCLVADDPQQVIMNNLKKDKEIITNKRIKLIIGGKSLQYLAKLVNTSSLLIALDGGGEHYLERYTHSFVIYTSGLPYQWRPFSLNPYQTEYYQKDHVFEYTQTSKNIHKFVFYRGRNRKPSYDLLDDLIYWKELDTQLFSYLLKRALKSVSFF